MQNYSINSKLILGTVQFGLKYGINNKQGKLPPKDIYKILEYAKEQNITTLDTADAYGDATDLIGTFHRKASSKFNIITKFKSISDEIKLSQWLEYTLKRLKVKRLEVCMFHSFDDYCNNSKLLEELVFLQSQDLVKYIGVSIYTNQELERLLHDKYIKIIQLPYNLLDNSFLRGDLINQAKEKGKIIHVRSVFLQGLFFKDISSLPIKLKPIRKYLNELCALSNDSGISMQSLALGYVHQNPNIDGVIIGIDNLIQLQSNIEALSSSIPQNIIKEIDKIVVPYPELLNPVNWS